MGVMRILGREGDTAVEWRLDDASTVAAAEALFRQLSDVDGMVPFARSEGAKAAEAARIDGFDAALDEILWVRPIAGG